MKVNRNITINLSADEVKEIIAEHLTKEGYEVKAEDVTLSIGSRMEGYGMAERPVNYFEGAYVNTTSNQ